MIEYKNRIFFLTTETTSYIFRVLETGQLENLHYGVRLPDQDFTALHTKITAGIGTTVAYGKENPDFSLDRITFEYSGIGKGDFRHTPMEIKMPDGTWVTDFVYTTHTITDGNVPVDGLPSSRGGSREDETCRTLTIALKDRKLDVDLLLFYTVYPAVNVIARRTALVNMDGREAVRGRFQTLAEASPPSEILRFKGLNDRTRYDVETVPQTLSIRSFGALIRHAAGKVRFPGSGRVFRALKIPPFKPRFRPDGCIVRTIDRYYRLKNGVEKYTAFGDVLRRGIKINQQFMGTWYNQNTRLLSDFGSNLFIVKAAREADSPGFGE